MITQSTIGAALPRPVTKPAREVSQGDVFRDTTHHAWVVANDVHRAPDGVVVCVAAVDDFSAGWSVPFLDPDRPVRVVAHFPMAGELDSLATAGASS